MQDVRGLPIEENEAVAVTLDELAREGARRMIAAALELDVEQYVASFAGEVDEDAKRLLVRNGRAKERGLTVGSARCVLRAPRVNDKRVDEAGERQKFQLKDLAGVRAAVAECHQRAADPAPLERAIDRVVRRRGSLPRVGVHGFNGAGRSRSDRASDVFQGFQPRLAYARVEVSDEEEAER